MVNVTVKRRDLITSCGDERGECKRTSGDASKTVADVKTTVVKVLWEEPGGHLLTGQVASGVYRRRDSRPGFRTELENLVGDVKGKGTSGGPARPKVPRRQPGADCFVVAVKRDNARGAKGAGHPHRGCLANWQTGGAGRFRRKAAAFSGWYEPCEPRGSRTDL